MTDGAAERIVAAGSFLEKLTASRWVLAMMFGVGAVAVYTLFEHRGSVFGALAESPASQAAAVGGFAFLGVGLLFRYIVDRLIESHERLEAVQRERIDALQIAVNDHRQMLKVSISNWVRDHE